MSDPQLLRMENVTKTFPGTVANDDVSLGIKQGEIHALLGENGAGKSTLMKILYGLYDADSGTVRLDGEPITIGSPQDAIDHGIGMVHQHFQLIPRLSVTENVVLGERREQDGRLSWWNQFLDLLRFDLATPRKRIDELASQYGIEIDPKVRVRELDIGQQQRVEILKALYRDVDLLILDEPTAVLTPKEVQRMFETLRTFVDEGLTIIFITHKLSEVMSITDRVTVLRNGKRVDTVETDTVSKDDLSRMMVGRDVLFDVGRNRSSKTVSESVLRTSGLSASDQRGIETVSDIGFSVRRGEIVGIAGVSGNGQKQLAECLAGVRTPSRGEIEIKGKDLVGSSSRAFIESGVSFIPEDRHRYGCAPKMSVAENLVLKSHRETPFARNGFMNDDELVSYAERLVEEYDIRGVSDVRETPAGSLSGGNLQKLILARELQRNPALLIANQPTRGVDVGAIERIRQELLEQCEQDTGVVLISEDLDEIFDLSDRILAIYEGQIKLETTPEESTPERVGFAMTGGTTNSEEISPKP